MQDTIMTSMFSNVGRVLRHAAAVMLFAGGTQSVVAADDPLASYYGNTLLCQNQSSKAICHLWLNPDRTFFVMYDRGVQPDVPVAGGNFRIEGRRGTYQLQGKPGAYEVCLKPDSVPGKKFAIEMTGEIYGGKACYALPERQLGSSWMHSTADGKQYKMWLVKGHG
ncbi:hypothetical protein [Arenimonas sp.]|uniref:hypothetical protein n=1 Tax=Arenimonas sp. TaxID=1872635 RepID=UPI0039E4ACCD